MHCCVHYISIQTCHYDNFSRRSMGRLSKPLFSLAKKTTSIELELLKCITWDLLTQKVKKVQRMFPLLWHWKMSWPQFTIWLFADCINLVSVIVLRFITQHLKALNHILHQICQIKKKQKNPINCILCFLQGEIIHLFTLFRFLQSFVNVCIRQHTQDSHYQ